MNLSNILRGKCVTKRLTLYIFSPRINVACALGPLRLANRENSPLPPSLPLLFALRVLGENTGVKDAPSSAAVAVIGAPDGEAKCVMCVVSRALPSFLPSSLSRWCHMFCFSQLRTGADPRTYLGEARSQVRIFFIWNIQSFLFYMCHIV